MAITELWTVKDAAAFLRVSEKTIYEMSTVSPKDGGPPTIRHFKIPKRKRLAGVRARPLIRFKRDLFIRWATQEP